MKAAEIDRQGERLKTVLRPRRPNNYDIYPRSTTAIASFPPPRMIPSENFRLMYERIYIDKPISLFEVAATRGPILPIPPPHHRVNQPPASLATILGLE
jgi:hypothetical protein